MITLNASSLRRQAQSLAKACYYHDLASRQPERENHGCTGDDSCSYCRDFPGAEWEAESVRLDALRDKALGRCGDHAAILRAIATDSTVAHATMRTVRLLGTDAVVVHAFGPGWRELPQIVVEASPDARGVWNAVEGGLRSAGY